MWTEPRRTEPEDHKLYHQLLNQQNQCEPNHNELNQKYEEPNRHEIDGCLDDWWYMLVTIDKDANQKAAPEDTIAKTNEGITSKPVTATAAASKDERKYKEKLKKVWDDDKTDCYTEELDYTANYTDSNANIDENNHIKRR